MSAADIAADVFVAAAGRTKRFIGRRLGTCVLRIAGRLPYGHAHNPTGLPSRSAKTANLPKSPGRSVGGTSRFPPSRSARSR